MDLWWCAYCCSGRHLLLLGAPTQRVKRARCYNKSSTYFPVPLGQWISLLTQCYQSNALSITQVACAHPVGVAISKTASPKQLSLARCCQSTTFSPTRVAAFATHPVLSILKTASPKQLSLAWCCHPSSFRRSPDLSAAAASTRGLRTGAPRPAGPWSARGSAFSAQDLRYIGPRYQEISALRPYTHTHAPPTHTRPSNFAPPPASGSPTSSFWGRKRVLCQLPPSGSVWWLRSHRWACSSSWGCWPAALEDFSPAFTSHKESAASSLKTLRNRRCGTIRILYPFSI
jgi:hypothetical protein